MIVLVNCTDRQHSHLTFEMEPNHVRHVINSTQSQGTQSFICPYCRREVTKGIGKDMIAMLVAYGMPYEVDDRVGPPLNIRDLANLLKDLEDL